MGGTLLSPLHNWAKIFLMRPQRGTLSLQQVHLTQCRYKQVYNWKTPQEQPHCRQKLMNFSNCTKLSSSKRIKQGYGPKSWTHVHCVLAKISPTAFHKARSTCSLPILVPSWHCQSLRP